MTEELEKKADEYISRLLFRIGKSDLVKFAEEVTQELQEQNTNLQIMLKAEREVRCNEDFLKRVTELEGQIEKMKCCGNCNKMFCNEQDKKECGYNYKHWELRV